MAFPPKADKKGGGKVKDEAMMKDKRQSKRSSSRKDYRK